MLNKELLKKDFMSLIKEGRDAISLISDSEKKAVACAQLAQAIALTGVLNSEAKEVVKEVITEQVITEEPKSETEEKKETKKKTSKNTNKKKTSKDTLTNAAAKEPAKDEVIESKAEQNTVPELEEVPAATQTEQPVEQVVEEVPEIVEQPVEQVEAEQVETEQQTPAQETELVDEWTDEMCRLKATDLEYYNWYLQVWGEERMCQLVSEFFEGRENDLSAIRPTNITGFVTFLYAVYMQENPEAGQ